MKKLGNRVWETTNTVGTGNAFTLLGVVDADEYRAFSEEFANGDEVLYCRIATTPLVYEISYGTLNTGAGTITPTIGVFSTSTPIGGAFVPITWSGTQNVISAPPGSEVPLVANDLEEYGVTAVGLALIQAANAAAQRTALGLDDARVTLSSGQSGGTVGKFVRLTSANTWTDASNAHTLDELTVVAFKESGSLYVLSGRITLSGLTAAVPYYLSTAGGWTVTAPAISATVRRKTLGLALNTTELLMIQSMAIGG